MEKQSMSQLLSTAKSELLNKIAQLKSSKTSSANNFYTQDLIQIEDVIHGLIFLSDGSIIKILEILPINFSERSPAARDNIADISGMKLKQMPDFGHIKMMNSMADITPCVQNIRNAIKGETNPRFLSRVEDYINHITELQKENTIRKRFFYIFEYQGDAEGKKTDDFNDIYETMYQEQVSICEAYRACGNLVLDMQNDSSTTAEVLYNYFNPKTAKTESFNYRIQKVQEAVNAIKEQTGEDITAPMADYIAPRGIRMGRWNYMVMDGVYHTFFCLKNDSYHPKCHAGWLDMITSELPEGDMDIIYKKQSHDASVYLLERTSVISTGISLNNSGNQDKQNELLGKAANAKYMHTLMNEYDEDMYDVVIIFTLRANSFKDMIFLRNQFRKKMKSKSFYFEESFLQTMEYFKMTMPFTYVSNEVFNSCRKNMTNSSFAALYCYTSFEVFDLKGCVMGYLYKNGTLYSIDNFNDSIFVNPHIFIVGTTGAGKTYTADMLTSRMRYTGKRIIYILPLKGHEYKDHVESMGGFYAPMGPGSKYRVNICEIRPESIADMDSLGGEEDVEVINDVVHAPSLLAQKITFLINWLRMLVAVNGEIITQEESGELNACFTAVYADFGITSENDSIWIDKKQRILKPMPIISDLYEGVIKNPKLQRFVSIMKPWVYGNCSNMNGQTNIDLENKVLAFDINEDNVGEDLLPAFMYIAFESSYGICKRDLSEYCSINLDEVWKMLAINACAKHIFKMIKILRAYHTCVICATQEIEDCMKNEYGKSILNLSAIKIFLRVNREEIKALGDSIDLSPENTELIQNVPQGYGFVCHGTERVLVRFKSSLLEEEIYTPDPKKKAKIRAKRLEMLKFKQ